MRHKKAVLLPKVTPTNYSLLNFLVDIKLALGNNSRRFTVLSSGTPMPHTSSIFSILLLSGDPDIQNQFKHAFKDASLTVAKNSPTLPKEVTRRTFDAVIVRSETGLIQCSHHTCQH